MADKVSVSRVVNASIEQTWRAWTVANELSQWFSSQGKMTIIEFDVRPGGKVRLRSPGSAGEYTWTYIIVNQPSELVFDILDFSLPDYPDGIGGICHVNFKAYGDKTEVTVWGKLPAGSLYDEYQQLFNGWNRTLDNLNTFVSKEN